MTPRSIAAPAPAAAVTALRQRSGLGWLFGGPYIWEIIPKYRGRVNSQKRRSSRTKSLKMSGKTNWRAVPAVDRQCLPDLEIGNDPIKRTSPRSEERRVGKECRTR